MKIIDSSRKLLKPLILSAIAATSTLANASPNPQTAMLNNIYEITADLSPEELHHSISYQGDNTLEINTPTTNISIAFDEGGIITGIEVYDETTSNALGYPPGYTVSDSTYSTYENINNDAYFQKIEDNNTIASPGDEMELASVSKVDKIISIDGSETSHINMSDFMNSITHPSLSKTFDQNNASHPIKVATNNI